VTPPFYIVKTEDAEYLPAKISGFTCSALSIFGVNGCTATWPTRSPLAIPVHCCPNVPCCFRKRHGLDPPRALLGPLSATHVRAFFSAQNISWGIFLGLMPTQEGDICAW